VSVAWIIIGRVENWETALNQPLPWWGLKPSYEGEFRLLPEGSLAWLYATNPVGGVIGLALIRNKYVDERTPLWPDEKRTGRVIWPLRFRLEIVKLLPEERWRTSAIGISDFKLFMQKGFQPLSSQQHDELLRRFRERFGFLSTETLHQGSTIVSPELVYDRAANASLSLHEQLQELVAEVGRLQHYHSQMGFPTENGRIDVVWKREINGAPTIAFEVELTPSVDEALQRLHWAHERWSARPCVVTPPEARDSIVASLDQWPRGFAQLVRVCSDIEMREVHKLKRDLRSLEERLGIY